MAIRWQKFVVYSFIFFVEISLIFRWQKVGTCFRSGPDEILRTVLQNVAICNDLPTNISTKFRWQFVGKHFVDFYQRNANLLQTISKVKCLLGYIVILLKVEFWENYGRIFRRENFGKIMTHESFH